MGRYGARMVSTTKLLALVQAKGAQGLFSLPTPVIRRLAGRPRTVEGRTLDPEMQLLLRIMGLQGPAVETLSITRGRRMYTEAFQMLGGAQPIGAVTDRTIDGPGGPLALRFYTPRGLSGRSPALVYLHGGGWVYGDLDAYDAVCRFLAEEAQVRVVSVDYRLAPEAQFPAGFEDAWAAWRWVTEHATGLGIEPSAIAVGGDSAGGNLSALVAQHAARTDDVVAPAFQLLIYPATDFVEELPSRTLLGEGYLLTKAFMDLCSDSYLAGDEDRADARLSPLRQDATGAAPAYVVTAGFDPLRDEGTAYVEHLRAAGVTVEHVEERGLIHGFANMVGIGRSAPRAMRRAAAALQRGLS
ncbi:alpha/beta hydrolase [Cytobacillus oceanisediminis]